MTQARGEKRPRHQRCEGKDRIGNAVRWDLAESPEKHAENHHGNERLNDGPERTQRRLLIAHLNVAPDEKVEKFSVLPYLLELQGNPSGRGRNTHPWQTIYP